MTTTTKAKGALRGGGGGRCVFCLVCPVRPPRARRALMEAANKRPPLAPGLSHTSAHPQTRPGGVCAHPIASTRPPRKSTIGLAMSAAARPEAASA